MACARALRVLEVVQDASKHTVHLTRIGSIFDVAFVEDKDAPDELDGTLDPGGVLAMPRMKALQMLFD